MSRPRWVSPPAAHTAPATLQLERLVPELRVPAVPVLHRPVAT